MRWGNVLVAIVVAMGCGTPAPEPPASLETDAAVLRTLKAVPSAPSAIEGPGQTPFFVAQRTHQIAQYPCATCHQQALPEPDRERISQQWSHVNIQLAHGQTTGMDCQTCHDYTDLQQLRLSNGSAVGFDQSYQVCQQCHFQQVRDWAGGAHGKRLGGWRGQRIIKNCADCHDPHAPAFEPRLPVFGPTIPRTGSGVR